MGKPPLGILVDKKSNSTSRTIMIFQKTYLKSCVQNLRVLRSLIEIVF